KAPTAWPARTRPTYNGEKLRGYAASAAANELPPRTLSRTSPRIARTFACCAFSNTNRNARSRSCPAASIVASSLVTSASAARSSPRRVTSSMCSRSASARRPAGSARNTIWPWRCSRSTTEARSAASLSPCTTSPPEFIADHLNDGIAAVSRSAPSGFAADAADDLFDRRVALDDGEEASVENRPHAVCDRGTLDRALVGALEDQPVDFLGRHQQFGDGAASAIAGVAAFRAARRAGQRNLLPGRHESIQPKALDHDRRRRFGYFAFRAQPPHEPLRQHSFQRRRQQIILDAHIAQARHRRGGRVGVHGRQHEEAGPRRLRGDLRGFQVADLADHDDVGIMS